MLNFIEFKKYLKFQGVKMWRKKKNQTRILQLMTHSRGDKDWTEVHISLNGKEAKEKGM